MFDLNSTIIDIVNAWIRVLRESDNNVWFQFNYHWCSECMNLSFKQAWWWFRWLGNYNWCFELLVLINPTLLCEAMRWDGVRNTLSDLSWYLS